MCRKTHQSINQTSDAEDNNESQKSLDDFQSESDISSDDISSKSMSSTVKSGLVALSSDSTSDVSSALLSYNNL